jgi:serine phosphatase RsbU (regulator of sigma subunit)
LRKAIADSILKLPDAGVSDSVRLTRLNALGWNLSLNDPQKATEYAEKARVLAISQLKKHAESTASIRIELATNYNTFGMICYLKGEYANAGKNFLNALAIYEALNDKSKISAIYNNLGSMNIMVHNYKDGEKYILKAIEIRKILCAEHPQNKEYKKSLSKAYNNLGSMYSDQAMFEKGLAYFKLALEIKEECGDLRGAAQARCNIGQVYLNQNKPDPAYIYFKDALILFRRLEDQAGIVLALNNIGQACTQLKKIDEGVASLEEALELEKKYNFKDDERNTLGNFAELYAESGNYKKANTYLGEFISIKDTLLNEKINKQTAELQEKYESTKKQGEIQLLKQQEKNSELAASRQKAVVYSIGFVLLLVIILAIALWNRNMIRKKANLELSRQKNYIEQQKDKVEHQKEIIEEKQKEILDSIHYARRIQHAVITSADYISGYIKEFFILYKPKDIVSGDFYWALHTHNRFYLATADCTGHGVPGAFMSLLNISILNEIVIEKKISSPDLILNEARKDIIKALNPGGHEDAKDGMDCILFALDLNTLVLEYASANNSFYVVRTPSDPALGQELLVCVADKMPVGKSPKDTEPFTLRKIQLQKGDVIYTLTDGLADQFGGPKGKKFKYKKLQELVTRNSQLPLLEQKAILDQTIEAWRGPLEQVDDILVIGLKV